MKRTRNILNYALILFFTITNTGLPLIKHVCQMMQTSSFEACEMCKIEEEPSTCCEEDNFGVSFTDNQFSDCCQNEIVLMPIADKFIGQKANLEVHISNLTLVFNSNLIDGFSKSEIKIYSSDSSPPFLSDNPIYLFNSVLLI